VFFLLFLFSFKLDLGECHGLTMTYTLLTSPILGIIISTFFQISEKGFLYTEVDCVYFSHDIIRLFYY